jgi:hypothetical protein
VVQDRESRSTEFATFEVTMTDFPIPPKIQGTPSWLREPIQQGDDKRVADEMLAISFWAEVREQAFNLVRDKLRPTFGKLKGKLSEQSHEVIQYFDQVYPDLEEQVVKQLGKDIYYRARTLAKGADGAFVQANLLRETMDQVQTRLLLYIQENGLLPYLEGEYTSVTEYIASKMVPEDEDDERPSINYQAEFLIKFLIPMLEKNGISRELILGIPRNFSKTRIAISYLRRLLDQHIQQYTELERLQEQAEDPEKIKEIEKAKEKSLLLNKGVRDTLEEFMGEVVRPKEDGGSTLVEFKRKLKQISSNNTPDEDPPEIMMYSMAGGKAILQINCENNQQLRLIQKAMGSLAHWIQASPEDLAKQATEILLKAGKEI